MPDELDPKIDDQLVSSAIGRLHPTRDVTVVSTRGAPPGPHPEWPVSAYGIGFLAGEKLRLGVATRPGNATRPPWMDIPLGDEESLAAHKIRFKPVVLKSLPDAEYRRVGDLRWVSNRESNPEPLPAYR